MVLAILKGSAKICSSLDYFAEALKRHDVDCFMLSNIILCIGENLVLWSSNIEKTLDESKTIPLLEDKHARVMQLITNLIESVERRDHLTNVKTVREIIDSCAQSMEDALLFNIALKELEDSLKSSLNSCIVLQRSDKNLMKILVKRCDKVKKVDFLLVLDLNNREISKASLNKLSNILKDLGIRDIKFLKIKAKL
ncbi:MAG: hypothetical protein GXO10_07300 [Crenarchaeota archaeon]|nr:hypothetical protein [Thermoproteota archaeon]